MKPAAPSTTDSQPAAPSSQPVVPRRVRGLPRILSRTAAVYTRELATYFVSPSSYVILFGFIVLQSVNFTAWLAQTQGAANDVIRRIFGQEIFWFLLVMIPPLLTMRTVAEEKRSGTYELLVTTGTSDANFVVGKFLASWTYFAFLWLWILPLFAYVSFYGYVDWGLLRSCYLGTIAIGGMYCAIGVFASCCSANPLVSAIIAVSLGISTFFVNRLRTFFTNIETERYYFDYLSPIHHFTQDFRFGVIDLRYFALYGTVALFALFVGTKMLERRRWW